LAQVGYPYFSPRPAVALAAVLLVSHQLSFIKVPHVYVFCHGFNLFSCENFTPNKKGAKAGLVPTFAPCILRF
jgi:hypothetical protein